MKRNGNAAIDRCEEEAVAWYMRNQVREDDVDETTVQRWAEWWDNPENRAAYASMIEVGREVRSLPRPGPTSDEELQKDLKEISRADEPPPLARVGSRQTWFARPVFSIAFAVSVALVAVVVFVAHFRNFTAEPSRIYATAPGEQRSFKLEDGSIITLGGDTSVNVRFTSTGRMVLLTRGEGMFRVQHETDRPFSVCAATGCTTAVGTVFDVRLYSNHTRVWVQEGAVMVTARNESEADHDSTLNLIAWPPVRLAPGQAVSYDSGGRSGGVTVDPLTAAGWTRGSLVYFGRPLGEVLEDIQRYTFRRLNVDARDALLLYSGSVLQQHIDEWIRGLPHVFPVQVVDCHNLQESLGTEIEDVTRACASDPDRILIRPR